MPLPSTAHIRGRNALRTSHAASFFAVMSALPYAHRASRSASRPRSLFALSASSADAAPARYEGFTLPKKGRALQALGRIVPTSAVVSTIALAFFVFGLTVSRQLGAFILAPSAASFANAFDRSSSGLPGNRSRPVSVGMSGARPGPLTGLTNSDVDTRVMNQRLPTRSMADLVPKSVAPEVQKPPERAVAPAPGSSSAKAVGPLGEEPKAAFEITKREPAAKPSITTPGGKVGLNRSWPLSAAQDDTKLIPLAAHLKFTNATLLNYFHLHKTGGVTIKAKVMRVFDREENQQRLNRRGQPMKYGETCYQAETVDTKDKSLERMWRCDFSRILSFSKEEIASVDMLMGHQYWEEGCEDIFGKTRSVKHFSIFRHPLPRKLSFFYHFFVRNMERDETKVGKDEVIKFLLGEEVPPDDARLRDAGPNYYASRMLSNGVSGYTQKHMFVIPEGRRDEAIATVARRLEEKFAFVGLQVQTEASQCMVMKALQVFLHAHGIDEMVGTERLGEQTWRLNTGTYPWTARRIWEAMTAAQRKAYKEVERVDLAIYARAVRRFKSDVKVFSCEHRVHEDAWAEDVFE